MKFTRNLVSLFALFFLIIWIGIIGKQDTFHENILLGFGGCLSSLFFYLQELWNNKKTRTLILQRIKERSNCEMVLINDQERIQLGSLMKCFIKQPGRIANATNNTEGLCLYKSTEKMKRIFEAF